MTAQNALLMRIAESGAVSEPHLVESTGMMTDRDCLLICMSDNVLEAIDRWNKSRKKPRRAA